MRRRDRSQDSEGKSNNDQNNTGARAAATPWRRAIEGCERPLATATVKCAKNMNVPRPVD